MLFDEDVPGKLARLLPQHELHTVVSMQWGGVTNGALLELIAHARFEAFLTGDKNMASQQRLPGRAFAVLIMSTIHWPVVRAHVHRIAAALDTARPGIVQRIDCGVFIPRAKRS